MMAGGSKPGPKTVALQKKADQLLAAYKKKPNPKLKQQAANSSGHATRALLLAEPPSVDGGEITDKGYINQRAVLTRRADAVARLNDDASGAWVGLS